MTTMPTILIVEDEARRNREAVTARLREVDAEMRLRTAVAAEAAKNKSKAGDQN
jgi:hypothetical protein